mgnify:CR=1 FL=1
MVTYEQDWMDAQHERFPPLLRSATLGRQWLTQMGDAAGKQGVSLQYCMAYCRHVTQSLEPLAKKCKFTFTVSVNSTLLRYITDFKIDNR